MAGMKYIAIKKYSDKKDGIFIFIKNCGNFIIYDNDIDNNLLAIKNIVNSFGDMGDMVEKLVFGYNLTTIPFIETFLSLKLYITRKDGKIELKLGVENIVSKNIINSITKKLCLDKEKVVFFLKDLMELLNLYKNNSYSIEETIDDFKMWRNYEICHGNTFFSIGEEIFTKVKSARSIMR